MTNSFGWKACCVGFRVLHFSRIGGIEESWSVHPCIDHEVTIYWPKHAPGEQIIQHFADKSISSSDAIKGELDGVPFHIYGMKEPDYVMLIMSTHGTMSELGEAKKRMSW